jgi:capsular exopolysaccharide synthesis family protein
MQTHPATEQSALREYLAVIRSRLWIIVVAVLATTTASLLLTVRQAPVYEASADVLLQPKISEQAFGGRAGTGLTASANADTEIQVMQSGSVLDLVTRALGYSPTVTIAKLGTTSVARITASSGTAASATLDANTYASTYAESRRQGTIDDLLAASTQLQAKLADLDQELADANQPLDSLDAEIASTSDPKTRATLQTQRAAVVSQLNGKTTSIESRRATYADQLDQLQVATNLTVTGGAQVVSQAVEPSAPVSPKPLRNGAIALGAGLILGLGLAFLFDHLDDRIRGKSDVERASGGLTVVGLIPAVPGWRDRTYAELITIDLPNSASAEAYRSLRTSLQFLGIERETKVVQITSSTSGEGKTTTVANLAVALADAGKRVIVVDCDLRRPRLHTFFGLDHELGITSVLLGDTALADAVRPAPGENRLAVLSSGPVPPNPSELLALRRFSELIDAFKAESDYVLIDSPPVLPVADARVISAVADVTFLVVTAERTSVGDVERSVEILRQVDAPLIGTILNAIPNTRRLGYRYGYDYYYGYGARNSKSDGSAGPPRQRRGLFRRRRRSQPSRPSRLPNDEVSAQEPASHR